MAKVAKKEKEELTAEEIMSRLRAFLDDLEGGGKETPAKKSKAAKAEPEEEEEEETETEEKDELEKEANAAAAEEMDFPKAAKIKKMDEDGLTELAEKIGLDTEDRDEETLKGLLVTTAEVLEAIENEDNDELSTDEVKALCKALAITPKKSLDANVEALKEYFGGETEEEETEKEEKDEDETDEGAEEPEKEEKAEKDADDEVDREAIAKKAELPDIPTMKKHLKAYNDAADEDDQIEVEEGKTKAAYRKLIEKLIDSEGNVAEWGETYIRNGEVCCCGIGLDEHTVKGKKGNFGKCLVTGKVFKVEDDGETTLVK